MTEEGHRELARVLSSIDGLAAISGYHCKLMDELYGTWRCAEETSRLCHSVKQTRQEVLWMNYDEFGLRMKV
jgi:DNA adenine methylase